MKSRHAFVAAAMLACILVGMAALASSCSEPAPSFRVALIGLEGGGMGEERNALAEYGVSRVEAELGAEVDFIVPEVGEDLADVFTADGDGYDLVISLGQDSSLAMLAARPADATVQAAALDFESSLPVPGEETVSLVRYRVEEGAYLCGYLTGWLTGRNDHPLTNTLAVGGFIGAQDDPLVPYYNGGFDRGFKAASPTGGTLDYYIPTRADSQQARAFAEELVKKGVDIIFCTPGPFNEAVVEVAEEKDILVILVGYDRSGESPDHVLASLVLRDDNAVFGAVSKALEGELDPGKQVWGADVGVWSLTPFYAHDPYIRRELKEKLAEEEEKVGRIDFSSP